MDNTIHEHIEIVEGAGGPKAVIKGHRIRVEDIAVWHEHLGWPPYKIVFEYPQLTLADVYAALAYYWDHRIDMEVKMYEGELFVAETMRENPGRLREMIRENPGKALEILKNRRAE